MVPPLRRIERIIVAYADSQPNHPALRFHDQSWTYAALRDDARRRAALLCAVGIKPGEVIAATGAVSGDTAVSALACLMANAVYLFLSPLFSPKEIAARAGLARVRLVLTPTGEPNAALPHLLTLPQALPGVPSGSALATLMERQSCATIDDPAIMQATSGTTGGAPKITLMTHHHHAISAAMPFWWETAETVAYLARPMLYNPELCYDALHRGGTCILSDSVQPESIEAEMAAYGANTLYTVPAVASALVARRLPPPPGFMLHTLRTTAAPLTPELIQAIHRRYRAVWTAPLRPDHESRQLLPDRGRLTASRGVNRCRDERIVATSS